MRPLLRPLPLCLFACLAACGRPSAPPAWHPSPPALPPVTPPAAPALQKFSRLRVLHTINVEMIAYAPSQAAANTAFDAAFARATALFAMMDDYHDISELNQFCARAGQGPVKISPELMTVFVQAKRMHGLTGGAFDITLKPFVQMWRRSCQIGELPPARVIEQARAFTGMGKLILHPENGTAELTQPGMQLDLGGIAKGYIADEAVRVMRDNGCPRCACLNGGDRVFGDAPPDEPRGWRVEVPDAPEPIAFFIHNGAASVSGDVFRFVEIGGVRYSHVIDPKTGLGLTTRKMACLRGKRGIDTDPLVKGGSLMEEAAWQKAVAQIDGGQGWVFTRK